MEYSIKALSELAGVSTRTLRYYDEVGLLKPSRYTEAGYRKYSFQEVERLQLILFYRQIGLSLESIKEMINHETFDHLQALKDHRESLLKQRQHLDRMLETLEATIDEKEGGKEMKDQDKFLGLKEAKLQANEEKYGEEARQKFGKESVNASYDKFRGLDERTFNRVEALENEIAQQLKVAVESGDPTGDEARKLCQMHQEWIKIYWATYSKEAHLGLVRMYGQDERFEAYYEKIVKGGTAFLIKAMEVYLG